MPYYATSQEWLRQSALLLEARPSTTRITTTYHLTDKTGTSKKRQKLRQQEHESSSSTTPATTPSPAAPRASLTIKAYDPHSGTCLKYRTTKAAEVSRLILSLGQLGRRMAALPTDTDAVMADAGAAEEVGTPGVEKAEGSGSVGAGAGASGKGQAPTQGQQQGSGGGGGKGKKKRAKK